MVPKKKRVEATMATTLILLCDRDRIVFGHPSCSEVKMNPKIWCSNFSFFVCFHFWASSSL